MVMAGCKSYGFLLYSTSAAYASLYVAKYDSGFNGLHIGRPSGVLPTVIIALKGFRKFLFLISLI